MKCILRLVCVLLLALGAIKTQGQPLPCPPINTTYSQATGDTTICNGNCAPIHMTGGTSLKSTNTYTVTPTAFLPYSLTTGTTILANIDDIYSPVINLPFPFCFFGNKYTSCVIGSNGQICFDITQANQYCPWQITTPAPANNAAMTNTIMGAYYDILPSIGNATIKWNVYGTAPCRVFVVSWANCPEFQCNNLIGNQQIVLYESTYAIDIFVQDKPLCTGWNNGWAIEGIEDATSTVAITVPGRNATQWTPAVGGDGYRFTPDGTPQWNFTCFDNNNNVVSTQTLIGDTVTSSLVVCPTANTEYHIKAVATSNCDSLVLWDTVHVDIGQGPNVDTILGKDPTGCGYTDGSFTIYGLPPNTSYTITYTLNNNPQPAVNVVTNGSGQATITGIPAGIVTNIYVTSLQGCPSGPFGPITFTDPIVLLDSAHVTEPTQCGVNDGYITIYPIGRQPGDAVTVNYYKDNVAQNPFSTTVNGQGVIILSNLTSGVYDSISITYNNCTSPAIGQYILNDPQFLSNFDYKIHLGCNGDTVIFTNESGNGTSYTWDFGDMTSSTATDPVHVYSTQGIYTVVLHTFNGSCEKTTTHEITLIHPVVSSFTAIRDSICEHQTVQFDGSSSTNAYSYVWDFGDGKMDSTNKVSVKHTYDSAGIFTAALTVYDFIPCPSVNTHPIVVAAFRIGAVYPDTSVCIYKPMKIVDTLDVPDYIGALSFEWSPSANIDSTNIQQPNFYAADTQYHTYVVTMTSGAPFNCTTKDTITIYAAPHVHLTNVTGEHTITYGQSIHLNADGAYYFSWVPSLYLDNPNIKDPISTPTEPVIYTVVAMNQYGSCRDTAYVKINLTYDDEFVPTAFTPNGDGKNDVFRVINMRAEQKLLEFRVYDRWGQKVFETDDVTKGWDGTYNGQAMDAGVFQYIIRIALPDGTQRVHKGDVTLLR